MSEPTNARLGERLGADVLDSVVALFCGFWAGVLAQSLSGEGLVGWGAVMLTAFVYFTGLWSTGQSIGMRVAGIRMVALSGSRPGVLRAALRAIWIVPQIPSLLALFVFAFSDALTGEGHPNATDWALLLGSVAVVLLGLLAHLPLMASSAGVPIQDRISRVRLVRS